MKDIKISNLLDKLIESDKDQYDFNDIVDLDNALKNLLENLSYSWLEYHFINCSKEFFLCENWFFSSVVSSPNVLSNSGT